MRTILTFALSIAVPSVSGQGTIQFGFEEFSVDSTPPFMAQEPRAHPPPQARPKVADNTVSYIQAFEGDKFVWAAGSISMESPDGNPIQSVSLQLFLQQPLGTPSFGITGQGSFVPQIGVWQPFHADFSSPVQRIGISAFYEIGESFPNLFAIDAVTFVTIPEPRASWLLGLGLGAIIFRRKLRRFPTPKLNP